MGLRHGRPPPKHTASVVETSWQKQLREGHDREVASRVKAERNDGRTAKRLSREKLADDKRR